MLYGDHFYWYTTCDRCGCIIHNDDINYTEDDEYSESPYCDDCYGQYGRTAYLRSYNYKPTPIFYGDGNRYLGVELEIDRGGKDEGNAKTLCNLTNRHNDHIYIKTDGSLDDGIEIVTHPMTLVHHMTEMPWESLINQALKLDYTSHQAETCGLHVHVNRNSFSDNPYHQEECIARVLYIIERFWEELLRFSRRTEAQLKQWANRYGYKENPSDILYAAKSNCKGRYTCVNLTNYDTIEFRIFRGKLKYNTLIATLQLVDEICNVAIAMSDEEVAKLGWTSFIEQIDTGKSTELVTYLKERRLYINEPVLITDGEE